jgi:hypothetical protein
LAPDNRYFKLRGDDGNTYLVRHDERASTWELTMFRANTDNQHVHDVSTLNNRHRPASAPRSPQSR